MQLVPNACLSSYKVSFAVFLYYVRMTSLASLSLSLSLESRSLALLSCCAASQADAFNSAINFQKIHISVPTSLLTS